MSHAYSEDQLVEQPAIGLFDDLGWETVSAAEEAVLCGLGGAEYHGAVWRQLAEVRFLSALPRQRHD